MTTVVTHCTDNSFMKITQAILHAITVRIPAISVVEDWVRSLLQ